MIFCGRTFKGRSISKDHYMKNQYFNAPIATFIIYRMIFSFAFHWWK